ncbi:MAG TPA: gamma-glutamyl-phosphate reductase, partial [Myxococcales bacterium]|nr:gamma-glutamyl-phosphate reductase [Myxococcales bacterium]
MSRPEIELTALELAERARVAARELAKRDRTALVLEASACIEKRAAEIAAANEVDLAAAREAGHPAAFLDRLRLDAQRIAAMAAALRDIAALPDPVGEVVE